MVWNLQKNYFRNALTLKYQQINYSVQEYVLTPPWKTLSTNEAVRNIRY